MKIRYVCCLGSLASFIPCFKNVFFFNFRTLHRYVYDVTYVSTAKYKTKSILILIFSQKKLQMCLFFS